MLREPLLLVLSDVVAIFGVLDIASSLDFSFFFLPGVCWLEICTCSGAGLLSKCFFFFVAERMPRFADFCSRNAFFCTEVLFEASFVELGVYTTVKLFFCFRAAAAAAAAVVVGFDGVFGLKLTFSDNGMGEARALSAEGMITCAEYNEVEEEEEEEEAEEEEG